MQSNNALQYEVRIDRFFNAAPETLFAQWLDADALTDWFAPRDFMVLSASADPVPGGAWRVEFEAPDGSRFVEHGIYTQIVPYSRIAMTLHQDFLDHPGAFTVQVAFEAAAGGTRMQFQQTGFQSRGHRDAIAEGWLGCFDKLDNRLSDRKSSEAEIRALFERWYDASSRKDLDAAMEPISPDIVSYEHSMPLEIREVAKIREECKAGFDRAGAEFRWDVPDLQILVRDDIAVTWGLNRMRDRAEGDPPSEMWSRGTRIFRRVGDRWQLIHQHVSFPMDPATGNARFDLKPALG